MDKPLDPIPEKELCEYEKLRNRNIKEIEEAMAANNFFEDLREYKKEIGFITKNTKQIPKNANKAINKGQAKSKKNLEEKHDKSLQEEKEQTNNVKQG